jgi:carbon monoxide dehydrogenase subunit G
MASIRREMLVEARPDKVWDAIRDVGALHTRLVPGFVVGVVARERIVDIDDTARRFVWAVVETGLTHHNASLQVFDETGRSRVVWVADLLPSELAGQIEGMIDQAMQAMKRTLELAAYECLE